MNEIAPKIEKLINLSFNKRSKDLTFGPIFKNERTFYSLSESILSPLNTPKEIIQILDEEGYYCPDYRKGYAYKKDDLLKKKPPVKILRVLSKKLIFKDKNKEKYNELKEKFETRLTSNRKENINCKICITHNPFDVGLMSTNRNWTSCMDLIDGFYKTTPLKQIQYGGMCAYLIKEDDVEVKDPIARIAIKRLIGKNPNDFIFASENKIYGDESFAKELKFDKNVNKILDESNYFTSGSSNEFNRKDRGCYSDSDLDKIYRFDFSSINEMIKYINKHKSLLNKEIFYKGLSLFNGIEKYLMNDTFIKEFKDELNWEYISKHCKLYEAFIEKYKNDINWDSIVKYQDLSEDFIEKHKKLIDWNYISEYQRLSESFIEKHIRKINWNFISEHQKLSESFIKKHKRLVNWYYISRYQKLSESFIEKFIKKMDWSSICENQKLSEQFIEKYKDDVDWDDVSTYQKLSESFIEKNKDLVKWNKILYHQKLSDEFKKKYSKMK